MKHEDDKTLLLMPNPETQTGTALKFTGPLTRETLSEYSEAQLIRNAKTVIPRAFKALAKLVDQGDKKALELALATYSYVGKGGGVTIVNTVLTQNNNGNASGGHDQTPYFENILRAIERQEQKSKVVDVEPEDE